MSSILAKKKLLMAQKGGADVSELFNTSLWSGSSAARAITTGIDSGEGSLVWIKARDVAVEHVLFDTARGPLNRIATSDSNAAGTLNGSLTEFAASGYSLGSQNRVNDSTYTYVGWQFRRAEKFFDIVQYTGNGVSGRAIAHDLGVAPGIIIVKILNNSADWRVYHRSQGNSKFASLNLTGAFSDGIWPGVGPTDTTFSVTADGTVNGGGNTYIAYLFAHDPSPEGLIQCGSYVGNGSATGPVVNLGWRPQYLLIKNATGTGNWEVMDAERGLTASNDEILFPNTSATETSAQRVDPSSTGFQIVSTASSVNTSGQTYVYMAIREA